MRIVGYVRVSTTQQTLGDSLEAQEQAIREWAAKRGHVVVDVAVDAGASGTLDQADRPGLLEALSLNPPIHHQQHWNRRPVTIATTKEVCKHSIFSNSKPESEEDATRVFADSTSKGRAVKFFGTTFTMPNLL